MATQRKVSVGLIGRAEICVSLGLRAAKNGHEVLLFLKDEPQNLSKSKWPAEMKVVQAPSDLGDCPLIVIASRAENARRVIDSLGDVLSPEQMLLHTIRGFEPRGHLPISKMIAEECCIQKIGALLGPHFIGFGEKAAPSAAVVASRFPEVIKTAQSIFSRSDFRVYSNNDLLGVEFSSVAASVLAVALGLCMEMKLGPSTMALLITRGIAEMARLITSVGGNPTTAFGLAGLGDLMVQRDIKSREVELGRRLVRGEEISAAFAAVGFTDVKEAARAFAMLARRGNVDANIIPAIHTMLEGDLTPIGAIKLLMSLGQMEE